MTSPEIKSTFILLISLLLPGWSFLGITRLWEDWKPLQRWFIALGIGIAFYPALYYLVKWIPGFRIGNHKVVLLFILMAITLVMTFRKEWQKQIQFDHLELIGVLLFGTVIFSRIWMVHIEPFPAWSDSLHHSLVTDLTMKLGRLPESLEPFEPVNLGMYHLGLYSLSGLLGNLAHIPAHTALLITAQVLNALNILGIYVLLDRFVNRKAALVGVLVAGFLSFQPAWYFNWGRFTQVSGQAVILLALVLTIESTRALQQQNRQPGKLFFLVLASGLMTSSIFFLHIRVAAMYIPLLGLFLIAEYLGEPKKYPLRRYLLVVLGIGIVAVLLTLPVMIDTLRIYWQQSLAQSVGDVASDPYFQFTWDSIFQIGIQPWLAALTLLGSVLGIFWRNRLIILMLLWVFSLWIEGHLYVLNISYLSFVNYGAILIMYYIPVSIIIGTAIGLILEKVKIFSLQALQPYLLGGLLIGAFIGSHLRMSGIEDYRFFMTEQDLAAMEWIKSNTSPDALFAINTHLWNGKSPHGVDGGYWIPYFTGRKTTTGTMLFSLGTPDYIQAILTYGQLVSQLSSSPKTLEDLCEAKIDYFYIGAKRDSFPTTIDPDELIHTYNDRVVFMQDGAAILKVCP